MTTAPAPSCSHVRAAPAAGVVCTCPEYVAALPVAVIVIGSAGTWGRGPDLDTAWDQCRRAGGLGKRVGVSVCTEASAVAVDGLGCLCWHGEVRPVHAMPSTAVTGVRSWPARRSPAMRAAVETAAATVRTLAATVTPSN